MTKQIITSPAGERLVVVPEAEYLALVDAADDADDREAAARFAERRAAGAEELLPAALVRRMVEGENPVRLWREHRGLSARTLAGRAGIAQPYLSQIETGRRDGSVDTLRKIAEALGVTMDDIV